MSVKVVLMAEIEYDVERWCETLFFCFEVYLPLPF